MAANGTKTVPDTDEQTAPGLSLDELLDDLVAARRLRIVVSAAVGVGAGLVGVVSYLVG